MQEVLPIDEGFVGLGEALSWIAWRHARPNLELCKAIDEGELGEGATEEIQFALNQLIAQGKSGKITLYGRPRRDLSDVDADTLEIPRTSLLDCQRYEILRDALLRGSGLFWWNRTPLELVLNEEGCAEGFESVVVDREQLLAEFKPVNPCPDDRVAHFLFEQGEWVPAAAALTMIKPDYLVEQAGKHDGENKPVIRSRCAWLKSGTGVPNYRELYWWFWEAKEVSADWDSGLFVRRDSRSGTEYTATNVEFSLTDIRRNTVSADSLANQPANVAATHRANLMEEWVKDALSRNVAVRDAISDAQNWFAGSPPSGCKEKLRDAIIKRDGAIKRGRPFGAKSYAKPLNKRPN